MLDTNLPNRFTNGVLIHIGFPYPDFVKGEVYQAPYSFLVNADFSNNFPCLSDGRSFYDQINGIYIKQISHDENSATVFVHFSSQPSSMPTPPSCPNGENGNLNCDSGGVINISDFTMLLGKWGTNGIFDNAGYHKADIVIDNIVNILDYTKLLRNWTP